MKKIIEQTERYDIIQMNFRSLPITFRCWKDGSGIIEIRVDTNFAKANGYKSVEDMAEKLSDKLSSMKCSEACPTG